MRHARGEIWRGRGHGGAGRLGHTWAARQRTAERPNGVLGVLEERQGAYLPA